MDAKNREEFVIDKLSVSMDENGFVLAFKNGTPDVEGNNRAFSARISAHSLLKLIIALFQAGITYQDTFNTNIGFPTKDGEEHGEKTSRD